VRDGTGAMSRGERRVLVMVASLLAEAIYRLKRVYTPAAGVHEGAQIRSGCCTPSALRRRAQAARASAVGETG